jgi:hypothetical protein
MPKPSPRTHRAYTPPCWPNRAACSLEPELPRPPLGSHCRARTSACSPSPGTHLAPLLGHLGPNCATHSSALLLPSPESERRGRASTAPPPPLAGDITGLATTSNRSQVRPIRALGYLFASSSPTSPAASSALPLRAGV